MKSRWRTYSETDLEKRVHDEAMRLLEEEKDKIYDAVKTDIFDQALAVCFISLEQMGWGKVRLQRLYEMIDDMTHMMYTGIMGREMTTRDAQKHLKDKYGIDFSVSRYEYDD